MKHIENVVVGESLVSPEELFARDTNDWETVEKEQTYFTTERYLPRILVELGIYPSVSEIKRNRADLMITLSDVDFLVIRPKKKVFLHIAVGK